MEVVISNSTHSIKKTGLGLQTQTSTTTGCSKRTVTINLLNLGLNLPVAEQRFSFMNLLLGRRARTGVFPSPVFIQSFANNNSRRSNVPQVMSALHGGDGQLCWFILKQRSKNIPAPTQ